MENIKIENGIVKECKYNDYENFCCLCSHYNDCDLKYDKDKTTNAQKNLLVTTFYLAVTILTVLYFLLR